MRAPGLLAAFVLSGCALEKPDETVPIVILGWPPSAAVVTSSENIRVVAAARDDGANLAGMDVEVVGDVACSIAAQITSSASVAFVDHTFPPNCRPTGLVSVTATARDEAGWEGVYGPIQITVEEQP